MPSPTQLLIVVLVLVLLFGASKLPTLARSAGQSLRIFKSEMNEMSKDGNNTETPAVEDRTMAERDTAASDVSPTDQSSLKANPKSDD